MAAKRLVAPAFSSYAIALPQGGRELTAQAAGLRDLVERFKRDVQLERIRRERTLIGKHHPNLVQIFGGGPINPAIVYAAGVANPSDAFVARIVE